MKKTDRHTISIADDDRARIPFAMIGVLLLVSSTTVVTVLNAREDPETAVDVDLAMERTEAASQAAVRGAVKGGLEEAGESPVTSPDGSSPVGEAIQPDGYTDGGSDDDAYHDAVFKRYVRLRIYLQAREQLSTSRQELRGGAAANASLPEVENTEASVEAAIDRVDMVAGDYDDDQPNGTVNVTISDVTITVVNGNGDVVAERTTAVNTTVPTLVFQLHEKTQEYEKRLNTGFFETSFESDKLGYGFGRKFAIRQYPVSWGKSYFDRFTPYSFGQAFDPTHDNIHTEILANDAIYDVQESTFGTTDPYEDRIMRERWACFGVSTLYKLQQAYGQSPPSDGPDDLNKKEALEQNYSFSMMDTLNESVKSRLAAQLPDDPSSVDEATLCSMTRFLLGDSTGDFPEAPSTKELINELIRGADGSGPSANETENLTIEVDSFADAGYYQMRGMDVTKRIGESFRDQDRNVSSEDSGGDGDEYDEHDSSDLEEPDEGSDAADFNNKIEQVIEDTYNVSLSVSDSSRSGSLPRASSKSGDWDQDSSDYDVVSTEGVDVTTSAGPDSTPSDSKRSNLYDVTVEVTNEIEHTREWSQSCTEEELNDSSETCPKSDTTRDSGTVTFTVDVDIDATHSQNSSFDVRGMDHAYDSGGPGPVPNYVDYRENAVDNVFGASPSNLESTLESRIDGGSVESTGDLKSEMDYDEGASVNASLSSSEQDELESWLREEMNNTRTDLKQEIDSVNVTRRELASGDNVTEDIRENITDEREELIYEDVTGKYANPKDRARAELRAHYIDAVIEWTRKVEEENEEATDKANDELNSGLDGVDGSISNGLKFGQKALAGDVSTEKGEIEGSPHYSDPKVEISASPSYLSRKELDRSKEPAIRASNEGPMDTDSSASHAPLVTKYDNVFLPDPGFPLIPWPGYWYGTLSSWRLKIQGEYSRFEVRATTSDPSTAGPTTYVRDDRPVDLDIGDSDVNAGRVQPINFTSQTAVVVVVPSYQVMPQGTQGVGDSGANKGGWWNCSPNYPDVGPNPSPDEDDCTYILD